MLSKRTKYALHALVHLARCKDDEPVRIADLAESEAIPRKFLETILLDLKHLGLLDSRRGPTGGYVLACAPEAIALGPIIRHLDGPLAPLPCASETAYRRCTECRDERTCAIRSVMRQVRDEMARILDNTSLASLAARGGSPASLTPNARRPSRRNAPRRTGSLRGRRTVRRSRAAAGATR